MNELPLPAISPRSLPAVRRGKWIGSLALLGLAILLGALIGDQTMLAILVCALAFVVLATPFVETLAVLSFWLLPYLILNFPTGGITLKVSEETAYLFAAAALVRALLRREPIKMPPATPQVLLFLGVLALSTAFAPPVPKDFWGDYTGIQAPGPRSIFLLIWLGLSWMFVVGVYHVVGTSRDLFRRCIRAHILTGAFASLLGVIGYLSTLLGYGFIIGQIGHSHAFVFSSLHNGTPFYRLSGVSYEPLMFAFYLITVMPVTLAVAIYRTDWLPRWVSITALVVDGIAMLLTFSAGGWVSLIPPMLALAWLFRPKRIVWRKLLPAAALILVLLGASLVTFSSNMFMSTVMTATLDKIQSGGYEERDNEVLTGLRVMEDHPWLGVGPAMVPFYFPRYHPLVFGMDTSADVAYYINNLYITTLAENGVIGLAALAFCGVAGSLALLGAIRRRGATQVPVLTALTLSLVGCAIAYWEQQNLFLIYFPGLIGLAVAGARLAQTEAELP